MKIPPVGSETDVKEVPGEHAWAQVFLAHTFVYNRLAQRFGVVRVAVLGAWALGREVFRSKR